MPPEPRRDAAGLVVVGASVGGLVAAIVAADRGQRAVVLERTRDPGGGAGGEPGGTAPGGTRFQRIAGVQDSPETLERDILAATRHHVEVEVARARRRERGPGRMAGRPDRAKRGAGPPHAGGPR